MVLWIRFPTHKICMKPNNQMRFKNVGNFMNKLTVFYKLLKVEIIY